MEFQKHTHNSEQCYHKDRSYISKNKFNYISFFPFPVTNICIIYPQNWQSYAQSRKQGKPSVYKREYKVLPVKKSHTIL